MVVETFQAVITGRIKIIINLPAGMRLDYAVQKSLDAYDMEIFVAVFCAVCGNTGNLRFGIFGVLGHH